MRLEVEDIMDLNSACKIFIQSKNKRLSYYKAHEETN